MILLHWRRDTPAPDTQRRVKKAAVDETLTQIGTRHDTDKTRRRPKRPPLTDIYEPYLAPRRHEALRILEFGVERGGSLRMWRDYFPRAQIIGVDIKPRAVRYAGGRIKILIGDQKDPAMLDEIVAEGALDIVIDDGGHRAEDQQRPLLHLWPHLEPDGLYIVEDIHTSYRKKYEMHLRQPGTTVEFLKDVLDDVHQKEHRQGATLEDLEFIHFYFATCVMKRRGRGWGGLAAVESTEEV